MCVQRREDVSMGKEKGQVKEREVEWYEDTSQLFELQSSCPICCFHIQLK